MMMAAPEPADQQSPQFPVAAESEAVAAEVGDVGGQVDGQVPAPLNLDQNGIDDGDEDNDGGENGAAETERSIQLDDNYYEIEAVRRKRIHKVSYAPSF